MAASERNQSETRHRYAVLEAALQSAGVHVARETVNRISDTVLSLETRCDGGTFDRRWTDAQIEELVTAFRLRKIRRMSWARIARLAQEGPLPRVDVDIAPSGMSRGAPPNSTDEEVARKLAWMTELADELQRQVSEFAALAADLRQGAGSSSHRPTADVAA